MAETLKKTKKLWIRKFQCLLFVFKWSYICYDIICMAVPLSCYGNAIKEQSRWFAGLEWL